MFLLLSRTFHKHFLDVEVKSEVIQGNTSVHKAANTNMHSVAVNCQSKSTKQQHHLKSYTIKMDFFVHNKKTEKEIISY